MTRRISLVVLAVSVTVASACSQTSQSDDGVGPDGSTATDGGAGDGGAAGAGAGGSRAGGGSSESNGDAGGAGSSGEAGASTGGAAGAGTGGSGGNPPACPRSSPVMGDCADWGAGRSCVYGSTACYCSQKGQLGPPQWLCRSCPTTEPAGGDPCGTPELGCNYGVTRCACYEFAWLCDRDGG